MRSSSLGLVLLHCLWLFFRSIPGIHFFNLNRESSVPTWFSTLQLAAIGTLALSHLLLELRAAQARPRRWIWGVVACGFLFLSFDEFLQIHELIGNRFETFKYKWCYYYACAIAVVAPMLLGFLRERLGATFRHFMLGCALLVTGAVGMEMVEYTLVAHGAK